MQPILAFKISDYIYVFVFIGFIISFVAKKEKIKYFGDTIFAFGLLFVGIETIVHCIDRMGNSCVNIAEADSNKIDFNYFTA